MDEYELHIKRLAALARKETVPPVSVSDRVLEKLANTHEDGIEVPLTYLSMSSLAIAATALLVAAPTLIAAMDPFDSLARLISQPLY